MKIKSSAMIILSIALGLSAQLLNPRGYPENPPVDSSQQIADRIVSSTIPVLVDFWAIWCGPCRMLDPVMDTLKKEYKGRVQFIKVNVDAHRQLASYFRVQGIPDVAIIADSMLQNRIVGFRPKSDYKAALDSALAKFKARRAAKKPAEADSVKKKTGTTEVKGS